MNGTNYEIPNTRHFYNNFEYMTHLNFGGNFFKEKTAFYIL